MWIELHPHNMPETLRFVNIADASQINISEEADGTYQILIFFNGEEGGTLYIISTALAEKLIRLLQKGVIT